jgi:6-phosphogluconolactonase
LDHSDSNYFSCQNSLFQKIPIPRENIITIQSPHQPDDAASLYETQFRALVPSESLDLILLGVGPDGHTASLFPNHSLLVYVGPRLVVPIFDSPKPPNERITLTLSTINQSKHVSHGSDSSTCLTLLSQVIFVATGAAKVPTLTSIFGSYQSTEDDLNSLPAARVR